MEPASASARRSTTPAGTGLAEGTEDAEGGGGRASAPDVPSEIVHAAIGGEVATLPSSTTTEIAAAATSTVAPNITSGEREKEEKRGRQIKKKERERGGGRLSVGSLGTPAPRSQLVSPREVARKTHTEIPPRTRFRDGLRYEDGAREPQSVFQFEHPLRVEGKMRPIAIKGSRNMRRRRLLEIVEENAQNPIETSARFLGKELGDA